MKISLEDRISQCFISAKADSIGSVGFSLAGTHCIESNHDTWY